MTEIDKSTADKPGLAASLRMLADLIDEHPEMEAWFPYPRLSWHSQNAVEAAHLDELAEVFGVDVEHGSLHEDGSRYTHATKCVGRVELNLQAHTAAYEKATGKTVEATS